MHKVLVELQEELEKIVGQINALGSQLDRVVSKNGNSGMGNNNLLTTRFELIQEAQSISALIKERETDEIANADYLQLLETYRPRLDFLRQQTIGHITMNPDQAVMSYMFVLDGLRKAILAALPLPSPAEVSGHLKRLHKQLSSLDERKENVENFIAGSEQMVQRLEQAYNRADELPTELAALTEAKKKINGLFEDVDRDQKKLLGIDKETTELVKQLKASAAEAEQTMKECKTAYAAVTSVGLAAAFSERSKSLAHSMWVWVCGLVLALGLGFGLGSHQLHSLSELFKVPNVSTSVIVLNMMLSVLSVGGSVWFAWLATKQIGQRFRLAEDYAFKASISSAYEGFRREAATFGKEMEAKLLTSALARFDELPVRLVEPASYGSPWHELFASSAVKQAMQIVPNFVEEVKYFAHQKLISSKSGKSQPQSQRDMSTNDVAV